MLIKMSLIGLLLIFATAPQSCEIDTKLTMEGGNPPQFIMTGSGDLGRLVVRGHKRQRDIEGPDASAYWYIKPRKGVHAQHIEKLSPITYGKVPEGYVQVYPEHGDAVPLIENETYYVQVDTNNANGTSKHFIIRNGKVEFADYEYQLTDK